MPPKFPEKPTMGTRSQNENAHPGMPNAKQSRRLKKEMQDMCAQEAQQADEKGSFNE
jgi:hypothetical protein